MVRRRFIVAAVVAASSLFGTAAHAQAAPRTPRWAAAPRATIHPGVQTLTDGGQCTANFVFYDYTDVFIGQAAHCATTGGPTDVDGCLARSLPLGTEVEVQGASRPGVLVYSSWVAMRKAKERNADVCSGNDFALIRLSSADRRRINPSIPFWGGPTGLDTGAPTGEAVYSYGNSSLRIGLSPLSPKYGFSTGEGYRGWNANVYTLSPGIFGDSGSAFLGSRGGALGVLSTIEALPRAASNNVSSLSRALRYMTSHSRFTSVRLAKGTEPFRPVL